MIILIFGSVMKNCVFIFEEDYCLPETKYFV